MPSREQKDLSNNPVTGAIVREFGGVNTQSARQVLKDNEYAWLENVMPIGHGNAQSVPYQSAALATLVAVTCYYMAEGNISNTDYMFMFCTDGSLYRVLLTAPYTVVNIAPAATFAGSGTAMAQWENNHIVIIDPTYGFFDYDGTTLTKYKGTMATVTVVTNGMHFTQSPTITQTGGSPTTPATFTTTIQMDGNSTCTTAGTGYVVGDILTLQGGTYTTQAQIQVTSVNATTGAITGYNLITPGYYTVAISPLTSVPVTGGFGSGALFTIDFCLAAVTVATPGAGYTSAPTLTVTNGGASFTGTITGTTSLAVSAVTGTIEIGQAVYVSGVQVATIVSGSGTSWTITHATNVGPVSMTSGGVNATVTPFMNVTALGNCIAVYSGRVWIANGRTVLFTAPGTYNDFNPADLSGSFVMTDDTLKSNISRLFSSSNYLYIIGGSSINMVSNVTVTTPTYSSAGTLLTPSTTTFSNTNICSSIGTDMASTVISYYGSICFAVDYGIISVTGANPEKFSYELDGIFPLIDFTQKFSSGQAVINGILCLCFLVSYGLPAEVIGQWIDNNGVEGHWVDANGVTGDWFTETPTGRPLLLVFFDKKWFFASQGNGLTFVAGAAPDVDVPSLYGTDGTSLYKLFADTSSPINQTIQTKLFDFDHPMFVKQAYKVGVEFSSTGTGLLDISVVNQAGVTQNLIFPQTKPGYFLHGQNATGFGQYLGYNITTNIPGMKYIGFYMQLKYGAEWVI